MKDTIYVPATTYNGASFYSDAKKKSVANQAPNERAIVISSYDKNDFEPLPHFEERIPHASSLCFPKDSELKPLFDYQVIKMHNLGLMDKITFDHLDESKPEDKTNIIFYDDVPAVTFEGLYFPISLIVGGIVLAGFLAILERCCSNHLKKDMRKSELQLYAMS